MPLPKRKNTVLRLFDAPLYRDGLFCLAIGWVVLEIVMLLTDDSPRPNIVGALGAWVLMAIVPGWIRLRNRRKRWQRQQDPQAGEQSEGLAIVWTDRVLKTWHLLKANRAQVAKTAPVVETPSAPTRFSAKVHWDRINADDFERLLARLMERSGSYVRITRSMNVNAADAGRDIEA